MKTFQEFKDELTKQRSSWQTFEDYSQWLLQQDMYHVCLSVIEEAAELYASQYREEIQCKDEEIERLKRIIQIWEHADNTRDYPTSMLSDAEMREVASLKTSAPIETPANEVESFFKSVEYPKIIHDEVKPVEQTK